MTINRPQIFLLLSLLISVSCQPASTDQAQGAVATPTPLPTEMPADFQVTYYWEVGSLPPAYFYSYTITGRVDEVGKIEFQAGYEGDDEEIWVETFEIATAELETLYADIYATGLFEQKPEQLADIPTGGSADKMSVIAYGETYEVPSYVAENDIESALDAIYARIEGFVPQPIWDKLNAQHEQYVETHE